MEGDIVKNQYRFNDITLLKSREHLLDFLGIDEDDFQSACQEDFKGSISTSLLPYTRHEIPKRNKKRGTRVVWQARGNLALIYKGLARRLDLFFQERLQYFPHECSFGFIRGRNIRENAQCHIGAEKLLKTDIEKFFPSIKRNRIEEFLLTLDLSPEISVLLSKFLTIEGALPLGLATSPIISNAICHELDFKLKQLADNYSSTYSRYADDVTFSSNHDLPSIEEITEIIDAHGFALATEKTRILKRGQNFYVTGLSVSGPEFPHVPRKMKKTLRQNLYFANKFGLYNHIAHLGLINEDKPQQYVNYLDGLLKYVAFHEPNLAKKIVPFWKKILIEADTQSSFEPRKQEHDGYHIYIDETDFKVGQKKYLALGMSVSQYQEILDEKTKKILNDFISDPLSDGKINELEKKGLHFGDATEDLRLQYIKTLNKLPFKGYIVFGKLVTYENYEETYLSLLGKIISRRLIAAESKFAKFYVEENNKISKNKLDKVINDAHKDLVTSNNHHPVFVNVDVVSKKSLGVSVPDFLLGVFRKFILSGEPISPPHRAHIMFERLINRYSLILNADTNEEFTRRNPFQKIE